MATNENELYINILCWHLRQMADRLSQIPEDRWDWSPHVAAPTARTLAAHAWQWLICDRQHIAEPNALQHAPIPDPPADPPAMCRALAEETDHWEALIRGLTSEQLAAPHRQFNGYPMTVRDFVGHMVQNCIYKNGQLATLYFALGLDGEGPYKAPFPNPLYADLRKRADREKHQEAATAELAEQIGAIRPKSREQL